MGGCLTIMMIVVSLFPLMASADRRVMMRKEAQPFKADADILHLYVMDLLGGDSMLLQHKEQNLLIDIGGEIQYHQLKAMLDWLGVKEAAIFNAHPHGDHVGSLSLLLEDINIPVFYSCFAEDAEDYVKDRSHQPATIKRLKEANIPIRMLSDGDMVPFGEVTLRVHQQLKSQVMNECSAMLFLRFNEATMLLTADIGQSGQSFFSKRSGLEADIMKVPHHGIERLQKRFVQAVNPEFAFFTHGSGDSQAGWQLLRKMEIPHLFAT